MTVLSLLTGRLAPGVWRLEQEPENLDTMAVGLGWTVRRFDVSDNKEALISNLRVAVGAPAYVRANWDSIADGLKDIEQPPGGRLLIVADATASASADPARQEPNRAEHEAVLTSVLNEATVFWRRFGVLVQVVWVGPGSTPLLSAVDPVRASRLGQTARTGKTPDQ